MNIEQWLIAHEAVVRLSAFVSILLSMMMLEVIAPKRALTQSKPYRWFNNIMLVVFNTVLMRLLLPFATVGIAVYAHKNELGLLTLISWPLWLEALIALLILDCIIYWQHRVFHKIPLLWQLHRVHHIDQDIDVTTGSRFHPAEIFLSMLIKFSVVLLLGVPIVAVIIFEVLLNATAMFNHSNIALPKKLDRFIRIFLVTPDMHRVHHSNIKAETDTNFGFNISVWDRLFNSYTEQPQLGHKNMNIGVKGFTDKEKTQNVLALLKHPFIKS